MQKTVKSKSFGALKTHTDKSPSVAQLNTNLHTFKYFKYRGDFVKYYCSLVGLTSDHAQGHCTAKCYQRFHRLAASESCLSTLLCCLNVALPLLKADCVNISFVTSACLLSTAQRLVVENSVKQTFKTNLALYFLSKLSSKKDPPQTSQSPWTNTFLFRIDTFCFIAASPVSHATCLHFINTTEQR